MYSLIHHLKYEFLEHDHAKGKRVNDFILHAKGTDLRIGKVTKTFSASHLYYFYAFQQNTLPERQTAKVERNATRMIKELSRIDF